MRRQFFIYIIFALSFIFALVINAINLFKYDLYYLLIFNVLTGMAAIIQLYSLFSDEQTRNELIDNLDLIRDMSDLNSKCFSEKEWHDEATIKIKEIANLIAEYKKDGK